VSKIAAIFVFTAFSLSAFGQQVENPVVVGPVFDPTHAAVSDATVGTVIGNQQITNLPLKGRDYLQLAALSRDDAHYEQWEEACYEGMQPADYSLRSERDEK
jgi:hypothetical protein